MGENLEKKNEDIMLDNSNAQEKGNPPELERVIKNKIRQMSNGAFLEEEQEEIYDSISKKEVLKNEENGTLDIYLNNEIKRIIKEKIISKNKDNPIAREEELDKQEKEEEEKNKEKEEVIEEDSEILDENNLTEKSEENSEKEEEEVVLEDGNEEKTDDIPKDVEEACQKLGINKIKSYFYVNASDLYNKVDNTMVNEFGNRVLMLEIPSEKIDGPNKYYGMQNDKMVVYGNEDQAVKDVTGNVTKMGSVVEPLKLQDTKAVEFDDKDGFVVNEQIDDNKDLSVQEANNYRKEMEKLLEEYSREIESIKKNDDLNSNEKAQKLLENDGKFHDRANKIAKNNDISLDDKNNINSKMKEETNDNLKEIQEEEKQKVLEPNPKYGF